MAFQRLSNKLVLPYPKSSNIDSIGNLRFKSFGHNAYLRAAAFLSRLRLACWLHWTCSNCRLKQKKVWKCETSVLFENILVKLG